MRVELTAAPSSLQNVDRWWVGMTMLFTRRPVGNLCTGCADEEQGWEPALARLIDLTGSAKTRIRHACR